MMLRTRLPTASLSFKRLLREKSFIRPLSNVPAATVIVPSWIKEAFNDELLKTKETREFPPEKDPSFIIDQPQKKLTFPYLGQEFLNDAITRINESAFNSSSLAKPIYFIIKGVGRGKTRFLEELKYEYEHSYPQTLPISITFINKSIYDRKNEFYNPKKPYYSFILANITRIAASHYKILHTDLIQQLQKYRAVIERDNTDPILLLRGFLHHLITQQNTHLPADRPPIDHFLLFVDECYQFQKLFDPVLGHNSITTVLQKAFAIDEIAPDVKASLLLASDHPKAIIPLTVPKGSSIYPKEIQLLSLPIIEEITTKDIVKTFFLTSHPDYYENLYKKIKQIKPLNAFKLEYSLNNITNYPHSWVMSCKELDDELKFPADIMSSDTSNVWWRLGSIHRDSLPIEVRMKSNFPKGKHHYIDDWIIGDETRSKDLVDEDIATMLRQSIIVNSITENDFLPTTNNGSHSSKEEVEEVERVPTISIQLKPSLVHFQNMGYINSKKYEVPEYYITLLDEFKRFFNELRIIFEETSTATPYLRSRMLVAILANWFSLRLHQFVTPNPRNDQEFPQWKPEAYKQEGRASFSEEDYNVPPEIIQRSLKEAKTLGSLFYLDHQPFTSTQNWDQINPSLLSLMKDYSIFLPSMNYTNLDHEDGFAYLSTSYGKRQFLHFLNKFTISSNANDYSIIGIYPTYPYEKEYFDYAIVLSDSRPNNENGNSKPLILFWNLSSTTDHSISRKKLESYESLMKLTEDKNYLANAQSNVAKAFIEKNFIYIFPSLLEGDSYSHGSNALIMNRAWTERFFGLVFPYYRGMRKASVEELYRY